jgi:FkbM family methyltransferase
MISYAQNFEDVVLNRVFHNVPAGRYIDVGGFDPVVDSVTKHFYDKGWSGVNVEPVVRFHEKFEEQRPRDWNLNVVLGTDRGSVEFSEWGDSGLSTYRDTMDATSLAGFGLAKKTYSVRMITLADVTSQLDGQDVQFLKVDVEGAERDVLLGATSTPMNPPGSSGKDCSSRTAMNLASSMA